MGIEIALGDKVVVIAEGPDAQEADRRHRPRAGRRPGGRGQQAGPGPGDHRAGSRPRPRPRAPTSEDPNLLLGVAAFPGPRGRQGLPDCAARRSPSPRPATTTRARSGASSKTPWTGPRTSWRQLQTELKAQADAKKAAIFAAHQELLDDPDLLDIAESAIAKGKGAAFAWQRAYTTQAERLAGLKNDIMAGRAADLRDVGRRVLGILTGQPVEEPKPPPGSILIAEELTPSDTAKLNPAEVLGFATVGGGATSHVAILARALDIPAVAGIEPRALELPNGSDVILDGGKGQLRINPDPRGGGAHHRRQAAPGREEGRGPGRGLPAGHHHRRPQRGGGRQHRRPGGCREGDDAWGPKGSGCCAPSSSTWIAPRPRARTSRPRSTPSIAGRWKARR